MFRTVIEAKISDARKSGFALSLCLLGALVVHVAITHWHWSFLMDEAQYADWMPKADSFFATLFGEFSKYVEAGRLTLLKAFINLAKFSFLPLSPSLFRWIGFAQLMVAFLFSAKTLRVIESNDMQSAGVVLQRQRFFVFVGGLLLLQRPLWDAVVLVAIPEQYVLVFMALGAYFFFKRNPIYRFFFIAAILNKEPSVVAFFASSLVLFSGSPERRNPKNAKIDLALGLVFLAVARFVMLRGTYLTDSYQLFSLSTLQHFAKACAKVAIGLLPLLFLIQRETWAKHRDSLLFFFTFGIGYLALTAGKSAAGYLLIPAAWGLQMAVLFLAIESTRSMISLKQNWAFIATFLVVSTTSFERYRRFVGSFNDSTAFLSDVARQKTPLMLLTYAYEVPSAMLIEARKNRSSIEALSPAELSVEQKTRIAQQSVDLMFIEFTTYDGRMTSEQETTLSKLVSLWDSIDDRQTFRVFSRKARNSQQ